MAAVIIFIIAIKPGIIAFAYTADMRSKAILEF